MIRTEAALAQMALALGAAGTGGSLSAAERRLAEVTVALPGVPPAEVAAVRAAIRAGADPLGDTFCELRDAAARRADGAVYTPDFLVVPMVEWVLDQQPGRVVDGGSGSGRFIGEIVRRRPETHAVAVDTDPLATLMTRAVLSCLRPRSAQVVHSDYTRLRLPGFTGRTAFIGNPPYVRHHQLTAETKLWAQRTANRLGHRVSGLAGLHAYFFLATAVLGRAGDIGCFVTSAEWLDVSYGAIVRSLVLDDLGGQSLHVVEPRTLPFEGTQTTAVITAFRFGSRASALRLQDVGSADQLKELATAGRPVVRARLRETPRWTGLLRTGPKPPQGFIELGELCRVHRGTVTGANATFVLRRHSYLPPSVLYPSVTKARELFAAGAVLASHEHLRLVVDIPAELDRLAPQERVQVARFIEAAKKAGVDKGYIAAHRRAWWSVGLHAPAPILATYMARRPPAFVVNAAQARHINIAHGLYPRQPLGDHTLFRLADVLRTGTALSAGRTYAGGLVKFEPKEMERLMVPDLTTLESDEPLTAAADA